MNPLAIAGSLASALAFCLIFLSLVWSHAPILTFVKINKMSALIMLFIGGIGDFIEDFDDNFPQGSSTIYKSISTLLYFAAWMGTNAGIFFFLSPLLEEKFGVKDDDEFGFRSDWGERQKIMWRGFGAELIAVITQIVGYFIITFSIPIFVMNCCCFCLPEFYEGVRVRRLELQQQRETIPQTQEENIELQTRSSIIEIEKEQPTLITVQTEQENVEETIGEQSSSVIRVRRTSAVSTKSQPEAILSIL